MARASKKSSRNPINGWIILDKGLDITSTQALGKVKRILNPQKAGHAGTLDPMASGCLPIALGEATKAIQYAQDHLKTYEVEITWGQERNTDDQEGHITQQCDDKTFYPSQESLEATLPAYIGDIMQTPPQFAAVKINGERAYDIARRGDVADIKARPAYIDSIEIIKHSAEKSQLRVICGKGVYIRAIGRDLGRDLGCYGYISYLRRIKIGPFIPEMMITLDNLEKIVHSGDLHTVLQPVETILDDIPVLDLTQEEASRMKLGQSLSFQSRPDIARLEILDINPYDRNTMVKAYTTCHGSAVALIEICGHVIKPVRVFHL